MTGGMCSEPNKGCKSGTCATDVTEKSCEAQCSDSGHHRLSSPDSTGSRLIKKWDHGVEIKYSHKTYHLNRRVL